jgi:hypothetical protein
MTGALDESLRVFAKAAAAKAAALLEQGQPRAGAHAANWMRATREALEAARIADEPLTDSERVAVAEQVAALRRQIEAGDKLGSVLVGQRDEFAAFLASLAGEFESAGTPTAARVASRIRRELADVLTPGEHEAARDRLRARGVPLPEDENVPV